MILLVLLMTASAPPEVAVPPRLQVADGVDCPTRAQIQKALEERIGPMPAASGSDGTLLLEVLLDDSGGLNVRLLSATATPIAEKALAARGGSCAEVAQTIALLAKSWLADLAPTPEVVPPPDPPPPAPAPLVVATTQVVSPRADRPYRLSTWLAAQAAFGGGTTFGGALAVALSLPSRFGVGLQFSIPGALSGADSTGTMTVDRQVLALFASFDLLAPKSERSPTLALLLGPTLLHYAGYSHGYLNNGEKTGLEPGLVLGLRGSLPIVKGFFFYGELDGNAIANTLNFQVQEASGAEATVATQPSIWGSLSLGVGAQFF